MDLKRCDQCEIQETAECAVSWYRLGRLVPTRGEYVEVDLCSKECVRAYAARLFEGDTFTAILFEAQP